MHRRDSVMKFLYTIAVVFTLIEVGSPFPLCGQKPDLPFRYLSIEQGLSQSTVFCILQDSEGFMWFGTQDGLNRYDGYQFTVFKRDPDDRNSLNDNYINAICEDRSGILWIGTWSGGLNRFDPATMCWIHYTNDAPERNCLSHNRVNSVCEDRSGNVWIGTQSGLNLFDPITEQFTIYKHDSDTPTSLSHDAVSIVYEDRFGVLWIGTDGGGLNRFDRTTGQFRCFRCNPNTPYSMSDNSVTAISEDHTGSLWIGTMHGLNRFDRASERFTSYFHDPDNSHSLSDNSILAISEDRSGVFWIGTVNGLNRLDPSTDHCIRTQYDPNSLYGLSDRRVCSIYEDHSGGVWIGTYSGGLNVYDQAAKQFIRFQDDPDNPQDLGNDHVRALYEDQSGFLWIGTDGGGLNRLDRSTGHYEIFTCDRNDVASLSNNFVRAICGDRSGLLWIGTDGGGLNRYNRITGQCSRCQHDPNQPHSLSNNRVFSVIESRSEQLWIGTYGGGLNRLDRTTGRFFTYRNDPKNVNSLSEDHVMAVYEDRSGILWLGTLGGLNQFDPETKRFCRYRHNPNDPQSLSSNYVYSVYEDQSGILWIGTGGGGLNRFDRDNGQFVHFAEKDGLSNNVIYGILEDEMGNLWLSTNEGISKFNPYTGVFKNYDVFDGLQSNEFNSGAYFQSKSGEMFFGGINGITAFYPERITDNPYIPPIVITDFQIFNRTVPVGEGEDGRIILHKSITKTKSIELSYTDDVISFEYASLHFAAPEKNEYAYRMIGFKKEWNFVGNRRFATYTNLPPGMYMFQVKGSNSDGVWNEKGTSISIIINPPLWMTRWFQGLGIVAFLSLILAIYKLRTRQLRKKGRDLEGINRKLNEEMAERKRIEQSLKQSERDYRGLFESAHDAIVIFTPEDEIVVDVNQRACDMYGFSRSEFIGTSIEALSKDIDRGKIHIKDTLDKGFHHHFETSQFRKNGTEMHLEINASVIDFGGCRAILSINRDITERKKFEEALKESETRYRDLVEKAGVGILIDDEEGRFQFYNRTLANMFGYSVDEMDKQSIRTLVHPDDIERIMNYHQERLRGKGALSRYEGKGVRKDGSTVFLEVDATPVEEDGCIVGTQSYIWDITARKRTEEELRISEEQLRAIFEASQDGLAAERDGEIVFVNDAFVRLYGYDSAEELLGLPIEKVIAPEERQRLFEFSKNRLHEKPVPNRYESKALRRDGTTFDCEISVSTYDIQGEMHILGAVHDITERKRAEQSLRNERNKLQNILDTMGDAVIIEDKGYTVVYQNKTSNEIEGNYIGRKCYDVFHGRTEPCNGSCAVRHFLEEKHVEPFFSEVQTKDGQMWETIAVPIMNERGEDVVLEVSRNITERHRLRSQLQQSEKMSALGQLISGVAHELNNPLTGVLGFSQLLLMSSDLSKDSKKNLERIQHEADRARKIVQNLLTFARQHKPEKKNIPINDIVAQTLDLRAYEMRVSNIEIIRSFDPQLPSLMADEHQLQQVFMNIIINAEQAMIEAHGKGKLKVQTRWNNDRNAILVVFQDNGPGIPEEMLSKIFNPFFTTKSEGKGTGLGLSISYGIIEEHGGRITAVNNSEGGVTFIVELPAHENDHSGEKASTRQQTEEIDIDEKKVLVVDDEKAIVDLIRIALEQEGHHVDTASNGLVAIDQLTASMYDVIICDCKMPGKSGFEVYQFCEQNKPVYAKRFLFITGDMVAPESLQFLEKQQIPYMAKPFDVNELISAVNHLF